MYSRDTLGASLHLTRNKAKVLRRYRYSRPNMELSMSSVGKEITIIHDPRKGRDKREPGDGENA